MVYGCATLGGWVYDTEDHIPMTKPLPYKLVPVPLGLQLRIDCQFWLTSTVFKETFKTNIF